MHFNLVVLNTHMKVEIEELAKKGKRFILNRTKKESNVKKLKWSDYTL